MIKTNVCLLFVFVFGIIACKKESPSTMIPVDQVEKLAEMNQTLGWKIFAQEQQAKDGENVLISPFSIQTALQMALNGAKGNTLNEMLQLLDCPNCNVGDLNRLHADLNVLLTEQSGHPELTVANRFFYDKNRVTVKGPFANALAENYDCGSEQLDFDAEQAALDQINGWVKTNTKDKIEKILDKITPLDVAFLINALHFKADWATGFSPDLTFPDAFQKPDGSQANVDFVQADRDFSFAQSDAFRLVDIPFKDSTFSVSLIQPATQNTDADWHLNITPAVWKSMFNGMQYDRAIVFFPKMKLSYDNDLIKSLENLGVQDAFSDVNADFTDLGTNPQGKNIFIKQIKHKAVLEIDEKGAEGAAVTSIGFGITSLPPVFRFDKPFVLVLRHIPTDCMIFMGFVADPTE